MSKFGNNKEIHSLRNPFSSITLICSILLIVGTVFYHFVEGFKWLDALYFSVITLTTVGYGDLSPQTDVGKLFTIFYIISGIGIIFGFMNAFYEIKKEKLNQFRERKKKNK
jgi:voltage-gated potassium channel Kch